MSNLVEFVTTKDFRIRNVTLDNYLKQEEDDERLLLKLIFEIRKDKILKDLKIIIRPHPSVDLDKYITYFKKKFKNTSNIFIIRSAWS